MQQVVQIYRRTQCIEQAVPRKSRTSGQYTRGPEPILPGATGIHMKGADIATRLPSLYATALHFKQGFIPYGSRTADIARRAQ